MADKPEYVGPCARCGRPVKNAKMIGSLIVGRDCRRKMLKEGFTEGVHRCPLCHQGLPEGSNMSVKDNAVVLETPVLRRSLDEFVNEHSKFTPPISGPVKFELLSVEVFHEDRSVTPVEKRGGKPDDGKTVDGGVDESGRGDGSEDVSGSGGTNRQAEDAKKVHRSVRPETEPPEDA